MLSPALGMCLAILERMLFGALLRIAVAVGRISPVATVGRMFPDALVRPAAIAS